MRIDENDLSTETYVLEAVQHAPAEILARCIGDINRAQAEVAPALCEASSGPKNPEFGAVGASKRGTVISF